MTTKYGMSRVALAMAAIFASGVALAGNGAPSGAHYNLNIIGVQKNKTVDMTGNSGHRIFVPLWGNAKILLTEGDYAVLDANGTDGTAAFQLPAADANCDGNSDYSVFVRGLGKPDGKAEIQTCFVDKTTGELLCDAGETEVTVIERTHGKQVFTNESRALLTVLYDVDGDGLLERTPLFGDDTYGYAWDYDNYGLKLAQFRFYDEYSTLLNDGTYEYNCTPK